RADEAGDEHVLRLLVQVTRGADLLEQTILEDRDAVAHGQSLGLVVRDVDRGDSETALQRGDLRASLHTQLGVEVRQRLVHEEHLRLADDRTAHRDTLTLTAGERLRLAGQVLLEVEELGGLEDASGALLLADAGDLEGEAHVLGNRHVRVQRVVLEDHRDVAVLRGDVGDVAVADEDAALVDLFEAGEHAQRRGLTAAGGTDQDEEFAVSDLEIELVDGRSGTTWVQPRGVIEGYGCHCFLLHRQVRAGRSVVMDAVGRRPPWPAIGPSSVCHGWAHLGISQPGWLTSKTVLLLPADAREPFPTRLSRGTMSSDETPNVPTTRK